MEVVVSVIPLQPHQIKVTLHNEPPFRAIDTRETDAPGLVLSFWSRIQTCRQISKWWALRETRHMFWQGLAFFLTWCGCTCPRSLAPSPEIFRLLQQGRDGKRILNTSSHHGQTIVFDTRLNPFKDKQTFLWFRLVNVLGIKDYIVWSQTGHGHSRHYQICTVLFRSMLCFSFCFRIWEVITRYCALGWSGSGSDERKRTQTLWPPRCCTRQSRGLKSKRVGAATTALLGGWCCFIYRNVISSCLYKRVHVLIIKER